MQEYKELKKDIGDNVCVGYFCRNVETVTENIIKECIANQTDQYEENFKIYKLMKNLICHYVLLVLKKDMYFSAWSLTFIHCNIPTFYFIIYTLCIC